MRAKYASPQHVCLCCPLPAGQAFRCCAGPASTVSNGRGDKAAAHPNHPLHNWSAAPSSPCRMEMIDRNVLRVLNTCDSVSCSKKPMVSTHRITNGCCNKESEEKYRSLVYTGSDSWKMRKSVWVHSQPDGLFFFHFLHHLLWRYGHRYWLQKNRNYVSAEFEYPSGCILGTA